mmetsp:Transcript_118959/g.296831  ORF Transcript_118959/g.296831 Transcript_118959/m.296831 type:complete len:200 (-) Transcript_118959:467-1066(-)
MNERHAAHAPDRMHAPGVGADQHHRARHSASACESSFVLGADTTPSHGGTKPENLGCALGSIAGETDQERPIFRLPASIPVRMVHRPSICAAVLSELLERFCEVRVADMDAAQALSHVSSIRRLDHWLTLVAGIVVHLLSECFLKGVFCSNHDQNASLRTIACKIYHTLHRRICTLVRQRLPHHHIHEVPCARFHVKYW